MGFWDTVRTAGKVAAEIGKSAAEIGKEFLASPEAYYSMGQLDGMRGNRRRTYEFENMGLSSDVIKAYDRGYDDGRDERSS